MYDYFEILENAYRAEKEIEYSRLFKIAQSINKICQSIKIGCFWKTICLEWRKRRVRKYNVILPFSDFNYGKYPDGNIKILVYACVTDGYDIPYPPMFTPSNVDYILFSDNPDLCVEGWLVKEIPSYIRIMGNGTIVNRYFKMHPSIIGEGYDYSIYIDGNVQIMSNIRNVINVASSNIGLAIHKHSARVCIYDEFKACRILRKGNFLKLQKQIERYISDKFPPKFGLFECTIIVTDLHNNKGIELLDKWWNEFIKSESMRDQISLPYVIWKNGYSIDDIGNLGYNLKLNPKFKCWDHSKSSNVLFK